MTNEDSAHYWLVQARHATEPDELLHACQQAADLAPDDPNTLAELGRLLVEDHPGHAVRLLDRALTLAPDDLVIRYNRACAHARRRDRDAMLADLRVCLDAQPEAAEDAAGDEDLARYHTDPAFRALLIDARARRGVVQLPPGLRVDIAQGDHESFAVIAAPPSGVVLLRIAHYPYEAARLAELAQIAPPTAITPSGCADYGVRLATEIAKHKDLTVSAAALTTTKHGIAGWLCGVSRVWRVDDHSVVSPTPYIDVPPGVDLSRTIIRRAVMATGPNDAEWFEATGKAFAILMTHPLPDEPDGLEYARDVDDLAATITHGIAGWWLRP